MRKPAALIQFTVLMAATILAVVVSSFWPLIATPSANVNVVTSGKVLSVGPSTVSNSPYVILYSYDAPGFPRNGNPGSFQREQVVTASDLARFKAGMVVPVEYSRTVPGASRIKGFGSGSVFVQEQLQMLKGMAIFVLPVMILGFLLAHWRTRHPRKR